MHEIDGDGNVDGSFVEGDPTTGTPATVITADWLNAVQDELINVIEGAGIELEKGTNDQLLAAILSLAAQSIPLQRWQTNPDEYTVESQDIYDRDGHGEDAFYKYVFPAGAASVMYMQIGPMPSAGYDLQIKFAYRMTTSDGVNTVDWGLQYKAISAGEAIAEMPDYATWNAAKDGAASHSDTANDADTLTIVGGTDLVIPAAAYSQGDLLSLALVRWSTGGHAGNAEVADSIVLQPTMPAA